MVIECNFSSMEIMELAALLASRADVELQMLMVITSSIWGLDECNTSVETLRQECLAHGVEFTAQYVRDMPWTYYDNTSILDW